ncbi:hypothetical protein D3C76_1624230 [compost metagenome]
MNFQHGINQIGVSASVAHPPTGHRERLGESIDENRPVLHSRNRSEADVLLPIGEFRINLVRNHDQIMFLDDLRNRQPVLVRHDAARRIAGII